MGRIFLVAFRNILAHKRRALFLGSAIGGVTMILVVLSAVLSGVHDTLINTGTTLATGHVNIAGFFKVASAQSAPVVTDFRPLIDLVKKEYPDALIVDRLRGWGKVVSDTSSMQLGMGGIDIAAETRFKEVVDVASGNLDDLAQPRTALLFEKQAERLGVKVGDSITLSATTLRGAYNSVDVRVVAIGKDLGMISGFNMYASKDAIRDIYLLNENLTGAIQIYLKDPKKTVEVAEHLRSLLATSGRLMMEPLAQPFWKKFDIVNREDWVGQKLDVTTWEDEMAFLLFSLTGISIVRSIIGLILLVVVVGGTVNSMWMSIRERTREIGTLRAVGMGRRGVLLLFLVETVILTVGAALAGAAAGVGASLALDAAKIPTGGFSMFLMRDTMHLIIEPTGIIATIAVVTLVIGLFALFPAWRASRMNPVNAMQHAG
jgi:putative ABC transport system permease protein